MAARAPASPGASGTLLIGAWAENAAFAIDTSALTAPVVKIAEIDDAKITELRDANKTRLGRGIGFINSYDGANRPQMITGADNPGSGKSAT